MDDHGRAGGQAATGTHASLWLETTPETDYEALYSGADRNLAVDTVVVGGGIAGVTTAFKLQREGQSVALVERDRIVEGVTGHTTAKLTSQHGLIYRELAEQFDFDRARLYAEANEAAIADVEHTVEKHDIDCAFTRTPAYTYTEATDEVKKFREEAEVASHFGIPASFVDSTDLPYDVAGAVKFDDQATFHPRKYLLALADRIPGDGSYVFEETTVTDIDDGEPCLVSTDRGNLTADDVVVATHFPVFDHALYFARMEPQRSYVVAARLEGDVPDGVYFDPSDPYFSVRPHPNAATDMVLIGGQSHRTGHGGSTAERYRELEATARDRFDIESIDYRWSTQDFFSIDRVPFVGKHSPRTEHVFVATGFGGWGMTGGTVAGLLLSDLVNGRRNSWQNVYTPSRFEFSASKQRLVSHNTESMKHLLDDRVHGPPRATEVSLDPGGATIVDTDDGPVAASRDDDGQYHIVSAVCPHMGCLVEWNDGERSWDCPCHGSRFDADGTVLDTPALDDLTPKSDAVRKDGE
ncbi:FAD-dependent oxidoreductase [Haloferax namakaokahaiae]|uniref:FAD-dependent oxidoreductase n=1 Tax=Haloferax namakaokahaiae TaxID=1748331 RepID=A0ABD5ZDG6_9EURY